MLPAGPRPDEFITGVDKLRDDVDRFEGPPVTARTQARLTHAPESSFRGCCRFNASWCAHRLDEIIVAHASVPAGCGSRSICRRTPGSGARLPCLAASDLRLALEELGPIFMKFGQTLSTRRDLLPQDIADELEKLQDRVPPFSNEAARAIVEAAYERPTSDVFARFDAAPLAAATIAQVHARAAQGRQRSRRQDRAARHSQADRARCRGAVCARRSGQPLLERCASSCGRSSWSASTKKTIIDELNLKREAANAAQLQAQLRRLAVVVCARGLLGLHAQQRDGDGAHAGRADQ